MSVPVPGDPERLKQALIAVLIAAVLGELSFE